MNELKLAEILSEDKELATPVNIYQIEGEEIVTVIPKGRSNYIFFHPDEKLIINYSTFEKIYTFTVSFKEIKLIKNKAYYVFNIVNQSSFNNTRKEKRNYVYKEAIIQGFGECNFAKVLDFSKNGMRIETKKPLSGRIIDLYFPKNDSHEFIEGQVVWEKTEGKTFQYGLNIIQKGGISYEV